MEEEEYEVGKVKPHPFVKFIVAALPPWVAHHFDDSANIGDVDYRVGHCKKLKSCKGFIYAAGCRDELQEFITQHLGRFKVYCY